MHLNQIRTHTDRRTQTRPQPLQMMNSCTEAQKILIPSHCHRHTHTHLSGPVYCEIIESVLHGTGEPVTANVELCQLYINICPVSPIAPHDWLILV